MVGEEATIYRLMVPRCNFLGDGRPDVQYAAKEASRWMSKRCRNVQGTTETVGKYLNGGPRRVVQLLSFGQHDGFI